MPRKNKSKKVEAVKKEVKLIEKIVALKPKLKKVAKRAHKVPGNLRFAILVTIGVFWADFLKQAFVVGFANLPVHVSSTLGSLIAAVSATIIGLTVLESWSRIHAYFR